MVWTPREHKSLLDAMEAGTTQPHVTPGPLQEQGPTGAWYESAHVLSMVRQVAVKRLWRGGVDLNASQKAEAAGTSRTMLHASLQQ